MKNQLKTIEELKSELNKEIQKDNELSITNLYGIIDNVYETYTEKVVNGSILNCTTGNKDYLLNKLIDAFDQSERLDNKDVFALCDYNVVYEARLRDAINKGWLVPFRYYGIYDEINYDNVEYKNGRYNEKQLEEALMIHKRANLILELTRNIKVKEHLVFVLVKNMQSIWLNILLKME